MNPETVIDQWFAPRHDELVQLASELIAQNTENPPGNESAAARIVTDYFDRCGIAHETFKAVPGRANVIGSVGGGGKRLFVAGHLDTVPAGEGWTVPSFEATLKDGRLYGRGALDNKGPLAALMLMARCLKECFELRGTLLVGAVADEECGSELGLEYLLREHKLEADFAIIPDAPDNLKSIDIGEKGMLLVEIISRGVQAHASIPEQGVNAIWNLIAALQRFRERGLPPAEHPLFSPATHNLGEIEGGVAPNVVPGSARATIDIRRLPGQTVEVLMTHIRALLDEVEQEVAGAHFVVRQLINLAPHVLRQGHDLVKVIQEAAREAVGFEPKLVGIGGISVAKPLCASGILAVNWAPGNPQHLHHADESIAVDELLTFGRVLAHIAVRLLGADLRETGS